MRAPWLDQVAWEREFVAADYRFRWGRLGGDYVGEWPDLLALRAAPDGRIVALEPDRAAPAPLVDKLARGEAAAFARAVAGRLSLHAAAADVGGRAIVLLGPSGAGKSTIVAELCEAFGGALLADDVVGLDSGAGRLRVEPSERSVWLARGSAEKTPLLPRPAQGPVDIASLVWLTFDPAAAQPALHPMHGAAALASLLSSVLRFEPAADTWAREFDALGRLVEEAPMWELRRSPDAEPRRVAECALPTSHRTRERLP